MRPSPSTILLARVERVAVWSSELTFPAMVHLAKTDPTHAIAIVVGDVPEHAEVSISASRSMLGWNGKETSAAPRGRGVYVLLR